MNTRKNQKFKIHTRSVSEIELFTVHFQEKDEKKFFKACLVGTLNLCLKVPDMMQKTRDVSYYSGLRKCPKNAVKRQNFNLANS